jgi:tryptophanyl-tRNA synthetase
MERKLRSFANKASGILDIVGLESASWKTKQNSFLTTFRSLCRTALTEDRAIITPWQVAGKIDYEKLIEQFGTEPITEELLERFKHMTGELHLQLRRRIFFSHRDLNWILDVHERGERFVLYTGRGPSGPTTIGHMVPWIFTKYLQDRFDTKLYFQLTDDEKSLWPPPGMSLDETKFWTRENALDIIATGFKKGKTLLLADTLCAKTLYGLAVEVAKHVTYSTVKAIFGFEDSANIGIIFFPAMQAVPAFLESRLVGKNVPCLIPAAIDQDPYWRMTRDIAPKLGFFKPAQIHSKFLPGLLAGGKMSASVPESAIFTTDGEKAARRKIMNAFTGGRATVEEQRKLGGDPEVCPIFQYEYFLFEPEDSKVEDVRQRCLKGELLCGEHKEMLACKVVDFLRSHQERREKAKEMLEEFMVTDEYFGKKP